MRAGENCLNLIKSCEGLKLKAYLCPSGYLTIGYGHTRGVQEGQMITLEKADAFLKQDVEAVEADLPKVIKSPLSQGQWDALISLCYNLKGGPLALQKLAPKLTATLNAGDFSEAAKQLLDITKARGKEMPGLVVRRARERALFCGNENA